MIRNNPSKLSKPNRRDPRMAKAALWARLGYLDALAGAPYSPAYERATRPEQVNYEHGRLWAVSFLSTKTPAPAWPVGTIFPRKLDATIQRVCMANGLPSLPPAYAG